MAKTENTKPFATKIQSDRKNVIGEGNSIVCLFKDKEKAIKMIVRQVRVLLKLHKISHICQY